MFAVVRASAASSKAGLARSNLLTPRFFYAAATVPSAAPALVLGLRLRPVHRTYATQTTTTTTTTTTSTTAPAQPVNEKTVSASAAAAPSTKEGAASSKETTAAPVVKKEKEKPSGPFLKRAWATVKKEAAHYWAGTKLLGQEIKISSKLQWKVLNGGSLTRRERRQVS